MTAIAWIFQTLLALVGVMCALVVLFVIACIVIIGAKKIREEVHKSDRTE